MKKVLVWVKAKKQNSTGVKSVFHKYLLRSIIGSASTRPDIVIATQKSTASKYTLKKVKPGDLPRLLKFSVIRGIGQAYAPLLDNDGNIIIHDGKYVYRELESVERSYETDLKSMFRLTFGDKSNPLDEDEFKKYFSFDGLIKLCKIYLSNSEIDSVIDRFRDLLWSKALGQELEVQNPELDFEIKTKAWNHMLKEFSKKAPNDTDNMINDYYAGYGSRKFFMTESPTFSSIVTRLM